MVRVKTWGAQGIVAAMCGALLFGCAQTPTPSPTAQPDNTIVTPPAPKPAPVAEAPVPPPAPVAPAPVTPRGPAPSSIATTAALTPSGQSRYECQNGAGKAPIALPQGSERICSRFPAMGPCQYERDACRAKGGRVIRFDGIEITPDVEREYDRQVQRFKLNAG